MNNPIIVITSKGKGREGVDSITTKLFQSKVEADRYIENVTDLDEKYWTYARIVEDGEEIQLFYESFKEQTITTG